MKNLLKVIQTETIKHSPAILMGIGVAGMISAAVLTGTATIKAVHIVDEQKLADKGDKKEIIKATWKCYIPALVTAGVSLGCILGSTSISAKRTAALSAVYHISETALTDYKEAAKEIVGVEKEKEIQTKAAEKAVERNPVSREVVIAGTGNYLCFDPAFGKYFYSDRETIRKVINDMNEKLIREMFVSLNEFYYELGIRPILRGDDLGWNMDDGSIKVQFTSTLAEDGRPCLVMDYVVGPKYDF